MVREYQDFDSPMKFLQSSYVQAGTIYEYQYIYSAQTYEKLDRTKVILSVLGGLFESLAEPDIRTLSQIHNQLVDLSTDPGFKLQNYMVEYDRYSYKKFTKTLANYKIYDCLKHT